MPASSKDLGLSEQPSAAFLTSAHAGRPVARPEIKPDAPGTATNVRQRAVAIRHGAPLIDEPAACEARPRSVTLTIPEPAQPCPNIASGRGTTPCEIGGRAAQVLSPRSINEPAELIQFDHDCRRELGRRRLNYLAEPAYEGVEVELLYLDGELAHACALEEAPGEDITANVKTLKEIPRTLRRQAGGLPPQRLVVRGKIYMRQMDFQALNQRAGQYSGGRKFFANSRDAVIGSLCQADAAITAATPLRIFMHDIVGVPSSDFDTRWEVYQALLAWGFTINLERMQLCSGLEEAIAYQETLAATREALPYKVTGVVYKLERLSDRDTLGVDQGVPRWAVNYAYRERHPSVADRVRIKRFQTQEIIYHWVQGLPFLFLLASGSLILFSKFNPVDQATVDAVRIFHKVTATLWAVGLVVTFFFIGFKLHLVNLRQMLTWTINDLRWMILSARVLFDSKAKMPDAGKFNPGQKMNMLLVIGYFFGFLTSGMLMWFRGTILISWYIHVALFFTALGSLGGHLYLSFVHPSTRIGLGGIFHGWVPKKYIEHHHGLTLALDHGLESLNRAALIAEIVKGR